MLQFSYVKNVEAKVDKSIKERLTGTKILDIPLFDAQPKKNVPSVATKIYSLIK